MVEPRGVQHPRKFKDLDSQTRRNPSFEPQGVLGAAANPSASFPPKQITASAAIRGGVEADCRSTETAYDLPLIWVTDGRQELGHVYAEGDRYLAVVIGRRLGLFDTVKAATAAVFEATRKGRARRGEGSAD